MNKKKIYFIRKGELLTSESLKISIERLMIKKPLFVSSTLEEFNSLKKVNSFTMTFDQDICQKLYHILGLSSINNLTYPIFFMMQDILIGSKNTNVFVKIEEKAKNTIEVGIFSVNSVEDDKSLSQFVEKYLHNHLLE